MHWVTSRASFASRRAIALIALIIAALSGCDVLRSVWTVVFSSRIGRYPIMMGGAIFSALYAFPFFLLLETRNAIRDQVIAMVVGFAGGLRAIFGVQPAFYTELFEVHLRYSGIALAREPTGPSSVARYPLSATAAVAAAGGAWWPVAAIMVVLSLITVVSLLAAPSPVKTAAEADAIGWGTASATPVHPGD